MPFAPGRPCRQRDCKALTTRRDGYCEAHARQVTKAYDQARGSAAARLYGWAWQKARRVFLLANPLCVRCEAEDRVTAATVVDHIEPHRGDYDRFWDQTNWQPLCKRCHDMKTATEDGRWGPTIPGRGRGGLGQG